jgi:lipoprotein NlpI
MLEWRLTELRAAVFYVRGLAHARQGAVDRARSDFQQALQLWPQYRHAAEALRRL